MVEVECLSIAEFAEKAGVSKQAIYKQVNNENSQLSPYIVREGKRTLIKSSALVELYGVDTENLTFTTPTEDTEPTQTTPRGNDGVEEQPPQTTLESPTEQPIKPSSTLESQPISTDYIEFLKAQVADLKAEKDADKQAAYFVRAHKYCKNKEVIASVLPEVLKSAIGKYGIEYRTKLPEFYEVYQEIGA